ncbi:hypothetical protein [Nannocystis pusilla]
MVDDDPWLVKMICTALGERYECVGAVDGIEALAKALARPPHLIVSA